MASTTSMNGSLLKQRFLISVKIWTIIQLEQPKNKKRWLFGVHIQKSERASLSPSGCKNLAVHEIDCASLPIHVANLPGVSAGFPRLYDWMFPSLVRHVTAWDGVKAATAMNTLAFAGSKIPGKSSKKIVSHNWWFFMVIHSHGIEAVKKITQQKQKSKLHGARHGCDRHKGPRCHRW